MASPFLDFFTFLGICITRLNPLVKPPQKKGRSKDLPKFILLLFLFYIKLVTWTRRYQALVFASSDASVLTVSPAATLPAAAKGLAARP